MNRFSTMRLAFVFLLLGKVASFISLPPTTSSCHSFLIPKNKLTPCRSSTCKGHLNLASLAPKDNVSVERIGPEQDLSEVSKDMVPSKVASPPSRLKYIHMLRRRLDTAEDRWDIHKISSAAYVGSSLYILLVGIWSDFSYIPETLLEPTYIFLVSSVVQGITSIEMAMKYRRDDPIVQTGFINMATNMLSLGWATLIGSPFVPSGISEPTGYVVMLLSLIPVCCITSYEVATISKRLDHRKKRRNESGGDMGKLGDAFSYGLTTIAGFAASLFGIIILIDPSHDRMWLEQTFGSDGLVCVRGYYCGVLTSFAVACGALAITLRDRKVISKQTEQLMVGIPTMLFVVSQLKVLGMI